MRKRHRINTLSKVFIIVVMLALVGAGFLLRRYVFPIPATETSFAEAVEIAEMPSDADLKLTKQSAEPPSETEVVTESTPGLMSESASVPTSGFMSESASESTSEPETESSSEPASETAQESTSEPTQAQITSSISPAVKDLAAKRAAEMLTDMTLYEKVCQMLIVIPDSITNVSGTTVAGEITKSALEKYPVGGLILMSSNITGDEQVINFNNNVQKYSKIPLFLSCDEEGGRVDRLKTLSDAPNVTAMFSYRNNGTDTAFDNAVTLSKSLKHYGFNTNFAPVADVWSNPSNTVIGDRAFSDDFEQAAELVGAAVSGFASESVICSLKHFPGHGNTSQDSHYVTAYIGKTLEELRGQELVPFRTGINAGADMVMIGHLMVKEIDDKPATLSHKIVTGVLRDEMGYEGVIITDALNMQAMTRYYTNAEIAVQAVRAGIDILLAPADVSGTVGAILAAIGDGSIDEERIDASVLRILTLKNLKML